MWFMVVIVVIDGTFIPWMSPANFYNSNECMDSARKHIEAYEAVIADYNWSNNSQAEITCYKTPTKEIEI